MMFKTRALMIPAKNFSKNDFLFQYFQTVNLGLFLRITHLRSDIYTFIDEGHKLNKPTTEVAQNQLKIITNLT